MLCLTPTLLPCRAGTSYYSKKVHIWLGPVCVKGPMQALVWYSGLLPYTKDVHVMLIMDSKLLSNSCLSRFVSPAIDWRPLQCLLPSLQPYIHANLLALSLPREMIQQQICLM